MKRIAIVVVMLAAALTAGARSIHYFTYQQALRTVQYLDQQNELMIYCGYDYEVETYVLVNEVWMERVNSAYYEIWLYGFDAYTGDEVYMPLDLQCIWLLGANGVAYNAAQYLRFHASVPQITFRWYIPPYNPYSRRMHSVNYVRSYHFGIHQHGWMPPTPPAHGYGPNTQPPLPPYYMRNRQQPAPAPASTWTPGVDHPQIISSGSRSSGAAVSPSTGGRTQQGSTAHSEQRSSGTTTATSSSRSGNSQSATSSTRSSTATTPTRTNTGNTATSSSRGTSTTSTSGSTGRTGNTTTTQSSSRGTTTTTATGRTGNTTTTQSSSRGTTTTSTTNSSTGRTGNTTTTQSSSRGTTTSSTTNSSTGRTGNTTTAQSSSRGTTATQGTSSSSSRQSTTATRTSTKR